MSSLLNTNDSLRFGLSHQPRRKPYVQTGGNRSVIFERLLLFFSVVLLPFEYNLPTIGRFSTPFVLFTVTAAYIFVFRLTALRRVLGSTPFLTLGLFLVLAAFIESMHPDPDFLSIKRTGLTVFGGVLLASLARDGKALQAVFWGCICSGTIASYFLIHDGYALLAHTHAGDFIAADQARRELMASITIEENFNTLSRVAGLGAALGLMFGLAPGPPRKRIVAFVACATCLLGMFLPMSRGGMLSGIIVIAMVLYYSRLKLTGKSVIVVALVALVVFTVPRVVFSRAQVVTTGDQADSRFDMYRASFENVREFVSFGVGAGNFGRWGMSAGFPSRQRAIWVHNSFLQILINWGIAAFLLYVFAFWKSFKAIPKERRGDLHATGMFVLMSSLTLMMLFSHTFWYKYNAIVLGAVVGTGQWARPFHVRSREIASFARRRYHSVS